MSQEPKVVIIYFTLPSESSYLCNESTLRARDFRAVSFSPSQKPVLEWLCRDALNELAWHPFKHDDKSTLLVDVLLRALRAVPVPSESEDYLGCPPALIFKLGILPRSTS